MHSLPKVIKLLSFTFLGLAFLEALAGNSPLQEFDAPPSNSNKLKKKEPPSQLSASGSSSPKGSSIRSRSGKRRGEFVKTFPFSQMDPASFTSFIGSRFSGRSRYINSSARSANVNQEELSSPILRSGHISPWKNRNIDSFEDFLMPMPASKSTGVQGTSQSPYDAEQTLGRIGGNNTPQFIISDPQLLERNLYQQEDARRQNQENTHHQLLEDVPISPSVNESQRVNDEQGQEENLPQPEAVLNLIPEESISIPQPIGQNQHELPGNPPHVAEDPLPEPNAQPVGGNQRALPINPPHMTEDPLPEPNAQPVGGNLRALPINPPHVAEDPLPEPNAQPIGGNQRALPINPPHVAEDPLPRLNAQPEPNPQRHLVEVLPDEPEQPISAIQPLAPASREEPEPAPIMQPRAPTSRATIPVPIFLPAPSTPEATPSGIPVGTSALVTPTTTATISAPPPLSEVSPTAAPPSPMLTLAGGAPMQPPLIRPETAAAIVTTPIPISRVPPTAVPVIVAGTSAAVVTPITTTPIPVREVLTTAVLPSPMLILPERVPPQFPVSTPVGEPIVSAKEQLIPSNGQNHTDGQEHQSETLPQQPQVAQFQPILPVDSHVQNHPDTQLVQERLPESPQQKSEVPMLPQKRVPLPEMNPPTPAPRITPVSELGFSPPVSPSHEERSLAPMGGSTAPTSTVIIPLPPPSALPTQKAAAPAPTEQPRVTAPVVTATTTGQFIPPTSIGTIPTPSPPPPVTEQIPFLEGEGPVVEENSLNQPTESVDESWQWIWQKLANEYHERLITFLTNRIQDLKDNLKSLSVEKERLVWKSLKIEKDYQHSQQLKNERKLEKARKRLSTEVHLKPKNVIDPKAIDAIWINICVTLKSALKKLNSHIQATLEENDRRQNKIRDALEANTKKIHEKTEAKNQKALEFQKVKESQDIALIKQEKNISRHFKELQSDINDLLKMLVGATHEKMASLEPFLAQGFEKLKETVAVKDPLFDKILEEFYKNPPHISDENDEREKLAKMQDFFLGLLYLPRDDAQSLWEKIAPILADALIPELNDIEKERLKVAFHLWDLFETSSLTIKAIKQQAIIEQGEPQRLPEFAAETTKQTDDNQDESLSNETHELLSHLFLKDMKNLTDRVSRSFLKLQGATEEERSVLKSVIRKCLNKTIKLVEEDNGNLQEGNFANGDDSPKESVCEGSEELEKQEPAITHEVSSEEDQNGDMIERFLTGLFSFPEKKAERLWGKVVPILSKLQVYNIEVDNKQKELTLEIKDLFTRLLEGMGNIKELLDTWIRLNLDQRPSDYGKEIDTLQKKQDKKQAKLVELKEDRKDKEEAHKQTFKLLNDALNLLVKAQDLLNSGIQEDFSKKVKALQKTIVKEQAHEILDYLGMLPECFQDDEKDHEKVVKSESKHQKLEEELATREQELSAMKKDIARKKKYFDEEIERLKEEIGKRKREKEFKQEILHTAQLTLEKVSATPFLFSFEAKKILQELRNELPQELSDQYLEEEKELTSMEVMLQKYKERDNKEKSDKELNSLHLFGLGHKDDKENEKNN